MCFFLSAHLKYINSIPLSKRDLYSCFLLFTLSRKCIKFHSQISFLSTCYSSKIIPKGFSIHVPLHLQSNSTVSRKASSLCSSIVGQHIAFLRSQLYLANKDFHFQYLNLIRSSYINPVILNSIFSCWASFCRKFSTSIRLKHAKKFSILLKAKTFQFSFPPPGFICSDVLVHSKKVSLEQGISLSDESINLLSLGPKFSLPPLISDQFKISISASLDKLVQDYRWSEHFSKKVINSLPEPVSLFSHPFDKPAYLAPKPSTEKDLPILSFKHSILSVLKNNLPQYNKFYKDSFASYKITKKLSLDPSLVVVKSDKTNRLVVSPSESFTSRNFDILSDPSVYTPLCKPNISKIESVSNKIFCSLATRCPILKSVKPALISRNSGPARFFSLVKDHKSYSISGFPLRPIASVHSTPVEKLDWLANKVLSQLIKFVPSHLSSSDQLLLNLKPFTDTLPSNSHFISLDVVNLYPSIPISEGISSVMNFYSLHMSEINSFGLSALDLKSILEHVLSNYVISYKDKFFLQCKGVAMGSHVGPTFAILFMHSLESLALRSLPSHLKPSIYFRYIDDIILGPFNFDPTLHSSILEHFNSINPSIQFTLESASPSSWLPFLDVQFRNSGYCLEFCPYSKPFHSGICLNFKSHHPPHVKSNFVKNHFKSIFKHSSSKSLAESASSDFVSRLLANDYPLQFILSCKSKAFSVSKSSKIDKTFSLKLPFLHPAISRKLRKVISSSGLPIRLVEMAGPSISSLCSSKSIISKCRNCIFCPVLNSNISCQSSYVVYKLSCPLCNDFYVGQTYRKLSLRLREHLSSFKSKSSSSAFSQHFLKFHPSSSISGVPFSVDILSFAKSRSDLLIKESLFISSLKPPINRSFESFTC